MPAESIPLYIYIVYYVLRIGSSKHKKTKLLEFLGIKDPIKIRGAHLSYNADKNNDDNFFSKIRKMKTKLNLWQTRNLTLFGKSGSVLAKTLGVSQLIYPASLMTVPDAVTRVAQSLLFSFLWKNKKDEIKRNVVCQPTETRMVALILQILKLW